MRVLARAACARAPRAHVRRGTGTFMFLLREVIAHESDVCVVLRAECNPAMRRPVFGDGSWQQQTQRATLSSYEAFTSLRFLADDRGRRVEGRKLDKYVIRGREYFDFPGNPLGNKSKAEEDRFPRMNFARFSNRLDAANLWKRFYRMSKESFFELLELARPGLARDEAQGSRSSFDGVVSPEQRLSMTLMKPSV